MLYLNYSGDFEIDILYSNGIDGIKKSVQDIFNKYNVVAVSYMNVSINRAYSVHTFLTIYFHVIVENIEKPGNLRVLSIQSDCKIRNDCLERYLIELSNFLKNLGNRHSLFAMNIPNEYSGGVFNLYYAGAINFDSIANISRKNSSQFNIWFSYDTNISLICSDTSAISIISQLEHFGRYDIVLSCF